MLDNGADLRIVDEGLRPLRPNVDSEVESHASAPDSQEVLHRELVEALIALSDRSESVRV